MKPSAATRSMSPMPRRGRSRQVHTATTRNSGPAVNMRRVITSTASSPYWYSSLTQTTLADSRMAPPAASATLPR